MNFNLKLAQRSFGARIAELGLSARLPAGSVRDASFASLQSSTLETQNGLHFKTPHP